MCGFSFKDAGQQGLLEGGEDNEFHFFVRAQEPQGNCGLMTLGQSVRSLKLEVSRSETSDGTMFVFVVSSS